MLKTEQYYELDQEIIDFFKNFLLKESAMILLKDMGDELVYGDYIIRKL